MPGFDREEARMIRLHLLGSLALLDEGGSPVRSLLAQPKRFALLAYLATAPSPVAHRRDTLLGMFWPELDEEHARQALRQALYGLRQGLGSGVIVGTGEDLVSVDGQRLWCDAAAFAAAVKEGRDEHALELYRGPFLEGVHVSGVPAFERWMEGECRRLGLLAAQTAWRLVEPAAADRSKARTWAERALELAPYDEEGLRRYLRLMADHGESAAAARAYEAFAKRLAAELELEPSPETATLAERIRAGGRSGRAEQPRSQTPVRSLDAALWASPAAVAEAGGEELATAVPVTAAAPPSSTAMLRPRRLRRIALVTTPMVILLVGVFLLHSAGEEPPAAGAATSHPRSALAVLPFQNLSTQPAHAYFAAGLHDELLTQLSKVADLSLRGRSSVMRYAGTTKSARQIARELAVGTLVEGSVQVVGDRLRVNVKLIDASTDEHRWAESYDRTLDDAFAIQSDIARRVVAAVGATLGAAAQRALAEAPTTNADAYNFYLQGRGYSRRPGWLRHNFDIAEGLYRRAIALDPAFALAYVGLSEAHGGMHWFRYDPTARRAEQQHEAAEAALRLAPELPEAHMAMGLAYYWGRRDYRRALDEFAVARAGLPSDPWPALFIGYVHRRLGNWAEALAAYEKAAQLDPRDATVFLDLGGHTLNAMRRYEKALQAYERAQSLAPDLHEAAVRRARTYVLWHGQLDSLRAVLRRVPPDADLGALGATRTQLARLLHWERRTDSMLQLVARSDDAFDEHVAFLPAPLYAAWAHQLRGDSAAARAAFNSAVAVLDSIAKRVPDDWRVYAARGLAFAGLSRRDDALNEARRLAQSPVYRDDAFFGPVLAEERARILAQVREPEAALDELERILAGPSFVLSVHTLRLDPQWDPIREHPRFRALLARYKTD
jgi:TolB-like protein/DNA-binding SARP family transcriptional activator/Flp pilus assembly protein TadD